MKLSLLLRLVRYHLLMSHGTKTALYCDPLEAACVL